MTAQHVYQIHIRAEVEEVWRALTDPEATRQYFHATHWESPPVAGEPFHTSLPDGRVAIDGIVEEVTPPHRLVHTWHPVYDDDLAAEPPSRVTWEAHGGGRPPDPPPADPQRSRAEPAHGRQRPGRLGVDHRLAQDAARDGVAASGEAREPEAAGGA